MPDNQHQDVATPDATTDQGVPKAPKARRTHYSEPPVKITVWKNSESEDFYVQKALLTQCSDYFSAAFPSDRWVEEATGKVSLEDIDHTTFAMFVDWVHRQTLPQMQDWPAVYAIRALCRRLASLYILGDRLLVRDFRALVLTLAFEYFKNSLPWYDTITYAFDNLPEGSPFLQLVVDVHCLGWRPADDDAVEKRNFDSLPRGFAYKMMERYAVMVKEKGGIRALNPENYKEPPQRGNSDQGDQHSHEEESKLGGKTKVKINGDRVYQLDDSAEGGSERTGH